MVKTSILFEVSEEVNNLVVVPHKRNNTFSKLMATLLQGYIEDPHIRYYAEGTLDEMRKASVDVLDSTLDSMKGSLASLGIYTSELRSSTEGGLRHFSSYAENKRDEIVVTEEQNNISDLETEELKESISELKKQNETMMSMLQELINGNVPKIDETHIIQSSSILNVEKEEKPDELVDNKNLIKDNMLTPSEDINEEISTLEDLNEEDEENISASDILSGFLAGNVYSM